MLFELKSNAFRENDRIREIKPFTEGLNIVLGQDDKANSIGKSTFLLAVDFAFGGKSYTDRKNRIAEMFGHHRILFAHKFQDRTYYFCRSTQNPETIEECDKFYNPTGVSIKLKDFTDFLQRSYQIEGSELSFRETVSVFCHIAGKFETDYENPLKNAGDTSQSKSVRRFEKLFPEYKDIKPKEKAVELADEKNRTFSAAVKFGFINNSTTGRKSVEKLKAELEELKKDVREAKSGKISALFAFEGKIAQQAADIKKELKSMRSVRSRLQSEIAAIQNLETKETVTESDLKVLQTYFPDVNLKKIEDVVNFHKAIASIVNSECEDEKENLSEKLEDVVFQIEELEAQISPELKDIPQTVLEEFGRKTARIEQLEKLLENSELKQNLNVEKKCAEKELKLTQEQALISISEKINSAIKEFDEKEKSLQFEFTTQNAYSLYRKNDVGTGTKHLNLIIFDLAVLAATEVPFAIFDSYIFHELEDSRLDFVLSLFEEFSRKYNKQIFIAVDGQDKCSKASGQIIEKSTIVQLGRDKQSLFGGQKK